MDKRIERFTYCDQRFYPYLDQVFSRLPEALREEILNEEGFQVLADGQLPDTCGRCFSFEHPVETLIYLNPRALMQPDHRLVCSIARELAEYQAGKERKGEDEPRVMELLDEWGFGKEMDAVCFCDAVAGSSAFQSGYEWGKNQKEDYLMLHFGLYFDAWNKEGLASMPKDQVKALRSNVAPGKLLPGSTGREEKEIPEGVSAEEVFIEGVMAALKEIRLLKEQ